MKPDSKARLAGAMAVFALLLGGCQIQLISKYDDQTDKAVSDFQRKSEDFFTTMAASQMPDCAYDKNSAFYKGAHIDLSAISIRVNAIP